LLDVAHLGTSAEQRLDAENLLALLTPICKAFMTDTGLEVTNLGMQVFGGHGYIREWGMEQLVRDCRIAPIYEGTNGIQALDLLGRKVLGSQGKLLRGFSKIVHKFCEAQAEHPQLKGYVAQLASLNRQWGELTQKIGLAALKNPDEVGAASVDYLMYSGYVALAYFTAQLLDVAHLGASAEQRLDAENLLALLTPICKAFMTDTGMEVTNHGMQIFGGHGYIREWGMEQLVRDCRIAPIYEGTNGIQALDLLGRKVLGSQGKLLRGFTKIVHQFCTAQAEHPQLKGYVAQLASLNQQWGELTQKIGLAAMKNPDEVGAASVDYLMYSGYIILAYLWLRMAVVAQDKLDAGVGDAAFYQAKLATCAFYFKRLLPRTAAHLAAAEAGSECMMSLPAEHFGV
jgi:hypothetical protein